MSLEDTVSDYGNAVKAKISNPAAIGAPEDQLRAPLETLIEKHHVKLRAFPKEVLSQLKKTSDEVLSELASKDSVSKKIYDSYRKFQKKAMSYQKISEEGFSLSRGE